jgi:protein subunit release factor A
MEKYSIDLKNLKKEVRIDYFKSSGPGGQHKNKTMSCVRLYHSPTGIRVIATESRSQIRNRELAFKRLQVKLMELNIKDKDRIPTKKPRYVKEQILQNKKKRSQKKQSRKGVSENGIELYK